MDTRRPPPLPPRPQVFDLSKLEADDYAPSGGSPPHLARGGAFGDVASSGGGGAPAAALAAALAASGAALKGGAGRSGGGGSSDSGAEAGVGAGGEPGASS